MQQILVDCERMKYPNTGLYHYCYQLGKALQQKAGTARHFTFYVPSVQQGIFGQGAGYLLQQNLHKFLLPATRNYDLWHATHQSTDYFPAKRKIPVVLTVHDLNFLHDQRKNETKKKKYLRQLQEKIDRADHITTISGFVLQELKQHVHLENKKTSIIYNGCNIETIKIEKAPLLQPRRPFLFTIGTIQEKKNFHVLPALLADNDFELVIGGIVHDPSYKERIIAEAKKHGVNNRVHFTGAISEADKQWYYMQCTAFVFPSIAEGFGLPVVEAMYFGKPVLLSTLTSLPEIGSDAAFYFNDFDPGPMRAELFRCLQHFTDHPEFAEHVKARAGFFSWQQAAEDYLSVYDEVLARR
ncbi:glycosyltransferase family 4 protein [Sediminibacterium ginsengisoli]|uniref:Glycosyltransferase involved in cell wall bisynthesis n=1 Tax=Sediminibacterium ginsengisoli TaxID=413434 RepID=A0A1T4JQM0_9BACT|nr:glycosyltransferase family 1 protein [Sediminibacterium ginsengisoli]SJZ32419.1 Glycosyltransferase involved in cell wall bisynthesis [Sediminibacterium ginsengisoli]